MTQGSSNHTRLIRLGLPPAVSVLLHALLLLLIVLVGVRADQPKALRPRLAEIQIVGSDAALPNNPTETLAATLPTIKPSLPRSAPQSATALPLFQTSTLDLRSLSVLPESDLGSAAAALTNLAATQSPSVSFAGLKAHAAGRIVFVVDASGAVVPTLTYIKRRLAQSIDRLAPTQRFEIIFFREPAPDAIALEPRPRFAGKIQGLTRATPKARAEAAAWIDTIHAAGRSDPAEALAEAIALKPDLIFLLSTSIQRTETTQDSQRARLLTQLDTLNPINQRTGQRPIVIKTLQFLRPDPANLLRDIAFLHGDGEGSYRLLTASQLDAADPENTQNHSDAPQDQNAAHAAELLVKVESQAWPVVLGLPTNTERTAVRDATATILDLLDLTLEDQRDTRWSVLDQRASLFHAAAGEQGVRVPEMRKIAQLGAQGVLVDQGAELERRLVHALAAGLAGIGVNDSLITIAQDASDAGFPGTALRAALGAKIITTSEPTTQTQSEQLDSSDPRTLLLTAEAKTRAMLRANPNDPAAFRPLLVLLDDEHLHPSESVRRGIVWGKLAAAGEMFSIPWDSAPGPVALGRAAVLAQSDRTRATGIATLERLAARDDLGSTTRAEALWQAAIAERDFAQTDPDAQRRVCQRLRFLVERFGRTPHARDAAAAAIALGSHDSGQFADDLPSGFVTLALGLFSDHPAADRWRLGLAHRSGGLDRLSILEQIPPGSPETRSAADLYLQTAHALTNSAPSTDALGRALAYTRARELLEWYALALQAAHEYESSSPARAAGLYLALAKADHGSVAESSESLTLAAGRALLDAGRVPEGVAVLTDLAARLETENNREEIFWQCWARVLEALADSTDDAARGNARAHAARLRLIDPGFGGGPTGTRAMNAANRLDSAHEHDLAHGSAHPG